MVWTCKENVRKQTATEHSGMGTRGNVKNGKTQKQMDRWSKTIMTNHRLREEDTKDRDRWRNLVLGEGKPL
jgi:hypothetical protein